MPIDESSSTATLSRPEKNEVWPRRFLGILNGTLPPLTDEEIIEMADRRYEELRSGRAEGLTLEEHLLATR